MKITINQLRKIIKEEIEINNSVPSMEEMVAAVKAHAMKNYEHGGWDYVIEAFNDKEIAEKIGDAKTIKDAIKNIGYDLGILRDREDDIRAEIF